jgi:hypothetical protein
VGIGHPATELTPTRNGGFFMDNSMKSNIIQEKWSIDEIIGLVVFGGPTAIYCYWIGHTIFKIINIAVNLI